MSQIHPKVVAKDIDIGRVIRDEAATNIWGAVFFHTPKKFENLRRLEMLDHMAAINSVALSGDLAAVIAPKKIENVCLYILYAKLLSSSDGLGMVLHPETRYTLFLELAQEKSPTCAQIQDL